MPTHAEIINFITKCKKSASYFIEAACKTKHPLVGIIPVKLFKYQREALRCFRSHRFNIFRKCRQAGASTLTGLYALWIAMFFSNKTILIVSKRDLDAKNFLNEHIKIVFNNMPEWMRQIWQPTIWNEHEVGFSNGSIVRSLTSSPDTLRSNASSLNIIDEAAFMPDMDSMWASGWPTLQHGGCLASDSLVSLTSGLRPIKTLHSTDSSWDPINHEVFTDNGIHKAYASYHNNVVDTLQITTNDGHYVEATPIHKFRILANGEYIWKSAADLRLGDRLILTDAVATPTTEPYKFCTDIFNNYKHGCKTCGSNYSTAELSKIAKSDEGYCPSCLTTIHMCPTANLPTYLTPDIAKFIGCLYGGGFYDAYGRFGISCDRTYPDYIEWLRTVIKNEFKAKPRNEVSSKDWSVRFNNKALTLLFRKNGIVKERAISITIPQIILDSNNIIKSAFLSGVFETDGCISGNYVSLSTASLAFARQIQVVLLSLGIRSHISASDRRNGFSNNKQYRVSLKTRRDILKFRDTIGFISKTKRSKLAAVEGSNRSHKDTYTEPKALRDFYEKSYGLPSRVRQSILGRIGKCSLSREFTRQIATKYTQLATTTLGWMAINNLFEDKITNIQPSKADTYDISVEHTHCYIANGFISHNSVIVISTPQGIGNWYWDKWSDAEDGNGLFNPILINWWDMDWIIEANDPISNQHIRIAPTDGLRKCTTKEELEKWGPYWSPWLGEQLKALQAKGEAHLFKQEVLAEFLGGGGTIISPAALFKVGKSVESAPEPQTISEPFLWINQATNEREYVDFRGVEPGEGLWIWAPPVVGKPAQYKNGRVVDPGEPGHIYVAGVDIATGENNDFSAIQIFDLNTLEQVAEYMGHDKPGPFSKMVDWLGRWYNEALMNIERTGIGIPFIQDMQDLIYPNLWRRRKQDANGVSYGPYGFATTDQSKIALNTALVQHISEYDGQGFVIRSYRLYKQLQIYIRKRNRKGIETKKTGAQEGRGNHDDLVIAAGLCCMAAPDALDRDQTGLIPVRQRDDSPALTSELNRSEVVGHVVSTTPDTRVLIPLTFNELNQGAAPVEEQIAKFTNQLIAPTKHPAVVITKPNPYKMRSRR